MHSFITLDSFFSSYNICFWSHSRISIHFFVKFINLSFALLIIFATIFIILAFQIIKIKTSSEAFSISSLRWCIFILGAKMNWFLFGSCWNLSFGGIFILLSIERPVQMALKVSGRGFALGIFRSYIGSCKTDLNILQQWKLLKSKKISWRKCIHINNYQ